MADFLMISFTFVIEKTNNYDRIYERKEGKKREEE